MTVEDVSGPDESNLICPLCLNIGTSKSINFPFGTNGKLMIFGVPILQYSSHIISVTMLIFFSCPYI